MAYVTYTELFQYTAVLISIVSICVSILLCQKKK